MRLNMLSVAMLSVVTAVLSVTFAPKQVSESTTGGLDKRINIADGTELRILPLVCTLEELPSVQSITRFSSRSNVLDGRNIPPQKGITDKMLLIGRFHHSRFSEFGR